MYYLHYQKRRKNKQTDVLCTASCIRIWRCVRHSYIDIINQKSVAKSWCPGVNLQKTPGYNTIAILNSDSVRAPVSSSFSSASPPATLVEPHFLLRWTLPYNNYCSTVSINGLIIILCIFAAGLFSFLQARVERFCSINSAAALHLQYC